MRISKKQKLINANIKPGNPHTFDDALDFVKKHTSKKFDESLDVSVILGIDAKKSDQQVRGVLSLPKMPEKKIKIAVFAEGDDADVAKKNGADIVGSDDLIESVKKGDIKFDKCISTPQMMVKVSSIGQILGPKGIMPNPKLGTVTKDLTQAIKNIKAGQVEYKTDKAGIVHLSVGKVSFTDEELKKNITFFFSELQKKKPASSKGIFIKKIYINSTMGPGLQVDPTSVM
ncbi:MAG: 50S ribosomal protein L1 [Rickettsiales bacterium]|jgi:large subunit ribosomal protein L1|nr:50S ribosomal protein L1 [Rickettsiales bacterium]